MSVRQIFADMREKLAEYDYNWSKDNLFSANHRRLMVEKYGFTEAEFIQVDPKHPNQLTK